MIRINLTLPMSDKRKLDVLSERSGVSRSEMLRRWINDCFGLYCPNCPDGIPTNCQYYDGKMPFESRCITDSSIGYCILESQEE